MIPPVSLQKSFGDLIQFSDPVPSLGLAYIAAVLLKNDYEVKVLDAYVEQLTLDEIMNYVDRERPDVVGMSVLTTATTVSTQITQAIKQKFSNVKIVMGNVHASLFCSDLLQMGAADFIVHREGEYTMLELLESLKYGKKLEKVMGISYLDKGEVVTTAPRDYIHNLDDLPYPAWDLFPLDKYKTDPRTELIPGQVEKLILATRGCPNICTFCSSRTGKSLGGTYRMRTPEKVVDEMEYLYTKYGTRSFVFLDLAFPLIKAHGMALCNEIIRRGLNKKIKWSTELRVKPLDYEMVKTMKLSGCAKVNFGIEVGTDRILKLLYKNFTTDDTRRAVKMCHEVGIDVDGMLMMGLPTETKEDIMRTIDFAIELNIRYAIFNLFVPYPGCELYDTLSREGKIKFNDWSDFISYPLYGGSEPVYVPDGLTMADLKDLQDLAMKKFYIRPRFIFGELKRFRLNKIKHYWTGLKTLLTTSK